MEDLQPGWVGKVRRVSVGRQPFTRVGQVAVGHIRSEVPITTVCCQLHHNSVLTVSFADVANAPYQGFRVFRSRWYTSNKAETEFMLK